MPSIVNPLAARRQISGPLARPSPTAAAVCPWWDPLCAGLPIVAAYQPKGAASYAASLSNLANPGTYDAAAGVAPDWASETGWTFNGSTHYLTTGLATNITYTYVIVATWTSAAMFGTTQNGNPAFGPYAQWAGSLIVWIGAGAINMVGGSTLDGVLGVAAGKGYLDGVYVDVGADLRAQSHATAIGCLQGPGYQQYYGAGVLKGFAIFSSELTAPQMLTVSNAMAAL